MTPENEKYFYERFPSFFGRRNLSAQESCMCWGICCGDGWGGILLDLCESIEEYCKKINKNDFQFEQIKEKFGTLRVYACNGDDVIYNLIDEAEAKSAITCELTGKEGKTTRQGYWYRTVSDELIERENENYGS